MSETQHVLALCLQNSLPNSSFTASRDRARHLPKQLLWFLGTAELLDESFPVLGRVLQPGLGYASQDFVSRSQVSKEVQKYPGHLQEPQLLLHTGTVWSCSRFLFRLMGALEGRVCLLASLLPMAVLLCSPDSGDVKKLQDHLVYLLGWQGIFPHSVFSSVLSHLIDPSGGAFVTCLGRHVSKYNRLAC